MAENLDQKTNQEEQTDTKEILEKYDKESNFRTNIGRWKWIVTFLGVSFTLFHLYTASSSVLPSQQQGAIHLGTALGIIFLLFPAKKGLHKIQKTVPWYDVALAFTAMYAGYHKIFFYDRLATAIVTGYTPLDTIVSIVGILLLLEATRRTVGLPIIIVAGLMILYTIFGNIIPTQVLSHAGFAVHDIANNLWFRTSGVFGTPIQISAKFIFLFLFFGVILVHTNIGKFFNDIALALTGRYTGGTAKTAVVARDRKSVV